MTVSTHRLKITNTCEGLPNLCVLCAFGVGKGCIPTSVGFILYQSIDSWYNCLSFVVHSPDRTKATAAYLTTLEPPREFKRISIAGSRAAESIRRGTVLH